MCDAIKQNESEVGEIQFFMFLMIVYIICRATILLQALLKLVSWF